MRPMDPEKPKKALQSPARIATAAMNIPVMVIAGTIIGVFLSREQESPLAEIIIICTILLFFCLSMLELYYMAKKQEPKRSRDRNFNNLRQIIEDNSD